MIQKRIAELVCYGRETGLIGREDAIFTANRLLELLGIDELEEAAETAILEFEALDGRDTESLTGRLETILNDICDYAWEHGLIEENTVTYRDLFDTRIMGVMVDRPSGVVRKFAALQAEDPQKATDWFYKLSQDSNYIRRYRISKDVKWTTHTEYGDMDITINLSRPEKDPKEIAAARNAAQTGYPKCLLCRENVGYAGRLGHPARQNHRIIPIMINGSSWYFQYSPYVYYNEHCIAFNGRHQPMKIERATFAKLLDFVRQFPHYFVGSNADLPIVGGSILSHDHFQGGHYEFAMARAPIETQISFRGFEDVEAGIVKWPMSVLRISSCDSRRLVDLAEKILKAWRSYTDTECLIYAKTNGEPHNTITPIARMRSDRFELDLVLRNNITTPDYPLGLFHPHPYLHHIKKENIGLIEVMGLAVLPARLKVEMEKLREAMLEGKDIRQDELLEKHTDWAEWIMKKYDRLDENNIDDVLKQEIGHAFAKCLEHAGVYKRTPEGKEGFLRFIDEVNAEPWG